MHRPPGCCGPEDATRGMIRSERSCAHNRHLSEETHVGTGCAGANLYSRQEVPEDRLVHAFRYDALSGIQEELRDDPDTVEISCEAESTDDCAYVVDAQRVRERRLGRCYAVRATLGHSGTLRATRWRIEDAHTTGADSVASAWTREVAGAAIVGRGLAACAVDRIARCGRADVAILRTRRVEGSDVETGSCAVTSTRRGARASVASGAGGLVVTRSAKAEVGG